MSKQLLFVMLALLTPLTVACGDDKKEQKVAEPKPEAGYEVPKPDADGWITIFDGKTLNGWKASELPENWKVEEGAIVGRGPRSHLFYVGREFTDLEFQADVMTEPKTNSGMYFRVAFGPAWPSGYEAQVNNSGGDPVRTGSLYNFAKNFKQVANDKEWFNQHIICKGNHIVIKVDGKTITDFTDEKNTFKKGLVALQQHDPGSVVRYKNLKVKPLDSAKEETKSEKK